MAGIFPGPSYCWPICVLVRRCVRRRARAPTGGVSCSIRRIATISRRRKATRSSSSGAHRRRGTTPTIPIRGRILLGCPMPLLAADKLRLIVTGECNLSCFYCHNEGQSDKRYFISLGVVRRLCDLLGEAT